MNGFLLKEKLLKSQRLLLLVVDALTLLPIIILMLVLSSLKLTGINDVTVLVFFSACHLTSLICKSDIFNIFLFVTLVLGVLDLPCLREKLLVLRLCMKPEQSVCQSHTKQVKTFFSLA